MTRFARAAMDFATYFEGTLGEMRVVGSCPRRPVLRTPEGRTTSGGVQSVQHLVLEPDVDGHPSYTAGWVNTANHTAMIRTHSCLRTMHQRRFGPTTFGVDAAAYQRLFRAFRELCDEQEFKLTLQTSAPSKPPSTSSTEARRMRRSHRAWLVIGFFLLLGVSGVAALVVYRFLS